MSQHLPSVVVDMGQSVRGGYGTIQRALEENSCRKVGGAPLESTPNSYGVDGGVG